MADIKKTTLHVAGMHCPSCDILIQDKVGELDNVKSVNANYRNKKAEVNFVGSFGPDHIHRINQKISRFGYRILLPGEHEEDRNNEPLTKRFTDFASIGLILFILFYFSNGSDSYSLNRLYSRTYRINFNLYGYFGGAIFDYHR